MKKHPTILFVTDKFPWPLDDGGQIRTYQILKSLSAKFRVLLVSKSPSIPEFEIPIRELVAEVVTVASHNTWWFVAWSLIQALFTRRPYPLPKNFSPGILKVILDQIKSEKIAAVHVNHLDAAQYVELLQKSSARPKIVFDTHNILTTLYARLVKSEKRWMRKAYCWIQWRKMRSYEEAIMHKADCVAVCSEVDRRLLSGWGINNSIVVPNGVDIEFFSPCCGTPPRRDKSPNLVFVGAMDYLPNAAGIHWFLNLVDPELRYHFPSYKLTIVGKNPPLELLALERPGRVEFTGRVDDVRPYIHSADVFVVPLKIGGGTRLKILEALATGVPVVATVIGAEGLELKDRIHLRIVESASEMVLAIAELCDQRARAGEMAKAGSSEVRTKYTWSQSIAPLCDYYEHELRQIGI